jgi:hypothetical protein
MTLLILSRLIYEAFFKFPHFKVLKAVMHKWISGENDTLITYQVEIKTKKDSAELCFNELWIDEKKYTFHISREDRKVVGSFSKKETLKLNALKIIESGIASGEKPKKSSKGKLLLGYTFKNKKKFLSIKKFSGIENLKFTKTAYPV